MTWDEWLTKHDLQELQKEIRLPDDVLKREWNPDDDDRQAAWALYTQMRTRIATQPLDYRAGDEATALKSVYHLFGFTRAILKKREKPCVHFATVAVFVLNIIIRPFTAYWQRQRKAGVFTNADICHLFRAELKDLQTKLRLFQTFLGRLAEGDAFAPDSESGYENIQARPDYDLGADIDFAQLLLVDRPEMLAHEQDEVQRRRTAAAQTTKLNNLVGLAISGGGIRSATIALGATQMLAEKGVLGEVDFVSTVSGGGYLGGFLSSYLSSDTDDVGVNDTQLPFRRDNQCESAALRHLRNHSKYLIEGGLINRIRVVGQMLYGILMNLVIVLPLPMLMALVMHMLQEEQLTRAFQGEPSLYLPLPIIVVFIIMAALLVLLGFFQNLGRLGGAWATTRELFERLTGWWFVVALIAAAVAVQPALFAGIHGLFGRTSERLMTVVGLAALLAASPAGLGVLGRALRNLPRFRRLLLPLFWISGPLALFLLYFVLTRALIWEEAIFLPRGYDVHANTLCLASGMIVFGFFFLNINLTSPHRYYRDQLASCYLLQRRAAANGTRTEQIVDRQPLSRLDAASLGPYQLINATLNVSAGVEPELRGRNSDFFLFSKHWCGSPLVNYQRTADWEAVDGHLDLATAVAISGAAAAPEMGMTSIRGARFWMALFNVRLNYWLRRPDRRMLPAKLIKIFGGPGALYLIREIFGWVDHKQRYLNISDGGHLENLGIYELLRRRCKFIIALDGEQDPTITCSSLYKVIRFAWIDFGIKIKIELADLCRNIDGYSKAHFTLGTIDYADGGRGFLLYVKSSLTSNEPNYVLEYRTRFPDFPHQSTMDQLFEEDQFEAYRALGHHMVEELFRPDLIGRAGAVNVRSWFQALANSLLRR